MDGEIEAVISSLSPAERAITPYLNLLSDTKIAEKSGQDVTVIRRTLQFLGNKELLNAKFKTKKEIDLGSNGIHYAKEGLPERKLLNLLGEFKNLQLDEAKKRSSLSENEFNIALGVLKRKAFISVIADRINLETSKEEISKKMLEEKLLEELPIELEKLKPEQKLAFQELQKRRNIIETKETSEITFELTDKGKKIFAKANELQKINLIEEITPETIKSGEWKRKEFRHYDVSSKIPEVYGGKRQPYYQFLEETREKLVGLGFEEMKGPTIVNEFWNFDALFQPQFHAAREWSATYYIKEDFEVELPNKKIVDAVKKMHEQGWKYAWQLKLAKRIIPRPQGTAISSLKLASSPNVPGKYFAISRCYRPDVVDAKHLTEFNQMEGIILGKKLSFSNLLQILKEFAVEIAGVSEKDIRFRPSYFPFTEPSVEMDIRHEKLGWIEIGGAGIFRKEVVEPLLQSKKEKKDSDDVRVLAWGLGIDRLAMFKLKIHDIRYLFSDNLNWLRKTK
ncbi:phenylalanine--tRNA ligase subunit alpha [Candidatus Pacearchaeota archaeon CG06_land_8_20_14_3_00_35_12]|nr:MAG: phenylalanine--tRNA ligase subunit alpha [Candidatus Pacearchaeota archaeon CG06_land_8_20_14_3_00_35_12]